MGLLTEAPDLPSLGEMGSYLGSGLRRGCQGLGHITSGQGRASLSVGRERVTVRTSRGIRDTSTPPMTTEGAKQTREQTRPGSGGQSEPGGTLLKGGGVPAPALPRVLTVSVSQTWQPPSSPGPGTG